MSDCPVVETVQGKVKGYVLPKANEQSAKPVYAFTKIPFAKPPVGDLRFEPPQKAGKWSGVLDGTLCPPNPYHDAKSSEKVTKQLINVKVANEEHHLMSEDCLYLNVHTTNANKSAKLPVMFWIYGGGFQMGGINYYNGQVICGLQDVVLVAANYRVNIFGFLSLGNSTKWKGNLGLKDQVMALQWTKDNIENFGGDPNNITIYGESAGAISVGLHVVSPLSRGLFNKAISSSGVAIFPTMKADQKETLKIFLDNLKITETEPEAVMRKLKTLSSETIENGLDANQYQLFSVTIGDDFLPQHPEAILDKGEFSSVPYIIGCNSTEGYGLIAYDFPPEFAEGLDKNTAMELVKAMLALDYSPDKIIKVAKLIEEDFSKYFLDNDKYKWSKVLGSVVADTWFVAPSIQQAVAHADKGNRTYMYQMTHKMRCGYDPEYSGDLKKKPEFCEGDHCDDVIFTFGFPFANGEILPPVKFTNEERNMCMGWLNYIGNFARTGNPNQGKKVEVEWPQYDSKVRSHLVINNPFSAGANVLADRQNFWLETIKNL